jgi:phosphate-selective porin OprO and OprP
MKYTGYLLVAILTLAMLTAGAWAQTETASSQTVLNNTDRTSTAAQPATSDESSPAPVQPVTPATKSIAPVRFAHDGLWFSTSDGATQLHVHGYVQADDRMFSASTKGEELDTFLFRRIRPLFEGTLFNAVDYRFMPDFGQNNPQIQEAYLELKTIKFAKLRVGKFKEPIGLEVLRQDRDLTFAERSLASDLVPLRYIGAQISGSVLSDSIGYAGGYFDGSSDGSNGVFTQWAHGNEAAARLFFHPFATTKVSAIRQFGFGLAGSAGHQHGTIAGLKTMAQTSFFKYSSTALANGQHNRLSPQAYYYAGPFGLMGEYVLSSQDVLNKGVTQRMRNQAWQIEGSVVLTGEKNSYAGVRPRNSTEHSVGFRRWGGVELALRYSQLAMDGDAFPLFAKSATAAQRAKEQGIGVNWYLNRYVKLMTDYEHTGFRMAPGVTTPLHNENVLTSRIQLAF